MTFSVYLLKDKYFNIITLSTSQPNLTEQTILDETHITSERRRAHVFNLALTSSIDARLRELGGCRHVDTRNTESSVYCRYWGVPPGGWSQVIQNARADLQTLRDEDAMLVATLRVRCGIPLLSATEWIHDENEFVELEPTSDSPIRDT